MKKAISVVLSLLMIFSLFSVAVTAAEKELKITIANDLHYRHTYATYEGDAYSEKDFSHVAGDGQLWIESMLIIEKFLEEVAANDSEIVLLPGDLVDRGTNTEHEVFSQKLKDFESATGKRVFVVPGNHDYYYGLTPDEFIAYYMDFGYGEAIARDTLSASYVVELNDEYRLLAVDSCTPGEGDAGITQERKEWIEEQAKAAQEDGKKLISMMHHNILDHFIFGSILHPGAFVDPELELAELYAQYNIKYNFVAHTHSQDIKAYTGSNGVTIYDVLTSSINLYPLPYRNVTLGDKVKIRTEYIEEIDISSKQGIISDNCYEMASQDFHAYALAAAEYGLDRVITNYASASAFKSLLGLNQEEHGALCEIIDDLIPQLAQLIDTPFYREDAPDGNCLEACARKIRLDFPKTELKNFRELMSFFYRAYVVGDENYGLFSNEYVLLTASLTTILNELLSSVSAEDYAKLLNYLCDYFKLKTVGDFNLFAAEAITRIEGIEIFVSALANTVIIHFTTDEAPGDNNVDLPGYDEIIIDEDSLTIFERIRNFFLKIFDYILRVFGVGK